MRVLHIDRQHTWGGQLNRTLNVVAGLKERGHDAALITSPGSDAAKRARDRGVEAFEFPLYGSALWASLPRVLALVRRRKAQILHSHGARDHLLSVLVKSLGGGCLVARTRHNHQPLRSGGFSRLVYRQTTAVVGVSQWVCDLAAADGIPRDKLHTIHSAVDIDRFRPRPRDADRMRSLGLDPAAFTVGLVARLDQRKGVDLLLKAFRKLADAHPATPSQALIVGPWPEPYENLAEQLGVRDRVVFTGDRNDVPDLLPCMDVFAMPSRQEALGTAVVEAMAAGLPVVGSDVGGIPESITPDVGYVVKNEDVDGLADALGRMLRDPFRRREMATAARRRAEDEFSTRALVDKTERLYRLLLAGRE